MDREKMKQLIAERQEQRADIFKIEREDETAFTINGHQYQLVANYRDAFDPDKLGERFSTILSKYDYIVGDWGFEQLRLKGFYASSNNNAPKGQLFDTIQDYLYEYCNFGCAYFVIQNLDVRVPKNEHNNHRNRSRPHTSKQTQHKRNSGQVKTKDSSPSSKNQAHNNQRHKNKKSSNSNEPQIRERKTKVNPVPIEQRKSQTAVRTSSSKDHPANQRFVIRHK